MNLTITEVPFGERPPVTKPHPDLLKFLGEEGIRKMVDDHYESIRDSEIKDLFPKEHDDFEQAKKNASDFFIEVLGGTPHFTQNRGVPKMVGMHAPFRITPSARRVWLELYIPIFEKLQEEAPAVLLEIFWNYLNVFSIWMINTEED